MSVLQVNQLKISNTTSPSDEKTAKKEEDGGMYCSVTKIDLSAQSLNLYYPKLKIKKKTFVHTKYRSRNKYNVAP